MSIPSYHDGYKQGSFDTVVETLHGEQLSGKGIHHYATAIRETLKRHQVSEEVQQKVDKQLTAMIRYIEGIHDKRKG